MSSITSLKNKRLSAGNFKAAELAKILAYTPAGEAAEATAEYRVASGTSVIKNQEELDKYLEGLRTNMEKILAENKTIIIK